MGPPRNLNDPVDLRSYWYRFGGGDWGFQHDSVFHKACRNEQDHRLHLYDELSFSQVGSYEAGILVAKWWLPDLEGLPDKKVTIALSPDAFNKTDASKTRAEQFSDGIKQVLGPYGSLLMRYTDDEREAMRRNPDYAKRLFASRMSGQPKGQMCIAVKAANNSRIDGWMYLTDLLRFRPVLRETEEEIIARLKQTYDRSGVEAYERETLKVHRMEGPEVLPKLLIWKRCKKFIQFLSEAQHDDEPRTEDVRKVSKNYDDAGDSGRYTLMSYKEVESQIPKSYWLGERMEDFQSDYQEDFGEPLTDPSRLAMVQRTQSAIFDKQHAGGGGRFNVPRNCSNRHRRQ